MPPWLANAISDIGHGFATVGFWFITRPMSKWGPRWTYAWYALVIGFSILLSFAT